jgi:methionyl-tRNA formyltransferase
LTPENINAPESIQALRALRPDLIVIVAYGQILKADILALAPEGCVNLHGSLLPKYRGAAPIQWAVARGEQKTGVTSMFIDERMDAGDIILQEEELISADDTSVTLGKRLASNGAKLLFETIEKIRNGAAPRIKQDEAAATYATRLKKTDGLINWTMPAEELANRVRGFQPWPCCYFALKDNATVKILRARAEAGADKAPGTILETCGEGPLVQAGNGALRLLELQPEGKKPMSGSAFLCGNKIAEGELLTPAN